MTTKEVLSLNTGDVIRYRNKVAYVCDWICYAEPLFDSEGNRIDAEPVFCFSDGFKHTIHSRFWPHTAKQKHEHETKTTRPQPNRN